MPIADTDSSFVLYDVRVENTVAVLCVHTSTLNQETWKLFYYVHKLLERGQWIHIKSKGKGILLIYICYVSFC